MRVAKAKKVTIIAPRAVVVHVHAVPLYNLRADDPWWRVGDAAMLPDLTGALVKLEPPDVPEVTDQDVENAVAAVTKRGAVAVRVAARPKAVVHVGEVAVEQSATHRSVRQVVEAMVEEARTSDRDALRSLVESAMSRAGL